MNNPIIPPRKGSICSYSEKMSANTDEFLPAQSVFVVLRSGTSPMNICSFYILIIPYPYKPLDFIIFLQGKGKGLNFFRNINPIYSPSVFLGEFLQKRATFNLEDNSFLDFSSFGIFEARDNVIQPNINTAAIQRILHLLLLPPTS